MEVILGMLCFLAVIQWQQANRKRQAAELELQRTMQLFDVSLEVNSTIRKQDLLVKIMETSSRIMNAEASSVILVDEEKGELFFDLALGEKGDEVREIRLKIGEGIAGWVAQTGKSVKIDDAAGDERWSSKVAKRVDYPTRNMLCVPLVSKGKIIGVLQVLNKRGDAPFTDRDLQLLESIASPTAASLENAMLYDALEKSIHALKVTTAAKERMESELRIATDIQMGFLPRKGLSLAYRGVDAEIGIGGNGMLLHAQAEAQAIIRPAREVGGDFYDYFRIDENRIFFVLGDVSDKGIPAALFMAVTMTLLKGKMSAELTPGDLLTAVNQELYKDDSTMFATIFCGVLNVATGQLLYSDGGHCPPYIVRASGEVELLKGKKGLPLSVMDDMVYMDNEVTLDLGDRIIVYTDGITEAEDRLQHQYGFARLQDVLVREQGSKPEHLLGQMVMDVDLFADGAVQSDDIAVLIIDRNPIKE
ncbi:SpoIIE family protein phosphatase [Paenibacillus qinlingensis]|uniref:Serine phosphatase RsbU (Regulator of sigma subunit)/putative methionine-R-sulfoxide reductase with GAF domain n=1 Tax=Paenibacillus qinlingensis TaxID=1837343 RepID=A0ABU1NX29_9BACL|nr:SpoIIE family protein phosphatase [Paenibacillus qinlingensis]MDR6552033.1 serine phosphatase RsbU (regulator of sigma subunit)/putative methionine-R-sulfoxide reductase with GAF domain [Paenibacillus qinlingensis]